MAEPLLSKRPCRAVPRSRRDVPGHQPGSLGTFPDGQADYPVGGVSWYEAAAYAVFAGSRLADRIPVAQGRRLPWTSGIYGDILLRSNFSGKGPVAVGICSAAIGPYGQLDMAGNVKEWCWNESGRRPDDPRRRLERAKVHVRGSGRAIAVRPSPTPTASGWSRTATPQPASSLRFRATHRRAITRLSSPIDDARLRTHQRRLYALRSAAVASSASSRT